jgi:hypothetical protein
MKPDDHSVRPGHPALPAWKAFVVQFSRETDCAGGAFSGRIEHLSSGRRAHFESPDELLVALRRLLAELGTPAG